MDPLSIASGCAALISTIGTLSLSINTFVRTCREARSDLNRVARELLSLQTVLELIQDDVTDENKIFPKILERHFSGIVTNCNLVVVELQDCITTYGGDNRLKTKAGWAINGQGDVAKLRSNLEAHKAALELALDMLALHVTKEIKKDTTDILNNTATIKDDTAHILEEIYRLKQRLPKREGNDYILERFLEEMTTYTENVLDEVSIDDGGLSTGALSFTLEEEEEIHPAYLSDREMDSRASSPESYRLKTKRAHRLQKKKLEEKKRQQQMTEVNLAEPKPSLECDQKSSSPQQEAHHALAEYPRYSDTEDGTDVEDDMFVPPEGVSFNKWQETLAEIEREYWEEDEKEQRRHDREAYLGDHRLSTYSLDDELYYSSEEMSQDPGDSKKKIPLKVAKLDPNHIYLPKFAVATKTDTYSNLDIETFNGRIVINWPVPGHIIDYNGLGPEYGIESSYNSFTALTCSAADFPSEKDTLRPARFAKARKIKVVFSIVVSGGTHINGFLGQWEFITAAVAGLTRWLKPSEDDVPPWHNIIVIIEGPAVLWYSYDAILTDMGVLHKTMDLITKIDGVPLDSPYRKEDSKVMGRVIHATLHEYTVPPTNRHRHFLTDDVIGTEPLQVIAVAPRLDSGKIPDPSSLWSWDWTKAICKVLEPEFIIALPKYVVKKDMPSAGEFLKSVWSCQERFGTSKHEQVNQCVFTTPSQFEQDLKKMTAGSSGD